MVWLLTAGLQQLRELQLTFIGGPSDSEDAYCLKTLTGLGHLKLCGAEGLDDAAHVAIVCRLGSCNA